MDDAGPDAAATALSAVLVFTDVVDSTLLHERVGDAAARRLWAQHDRMARELVRRHHGREVGRSDGFLLLFERCEDALAFAAHYHLLLARLEVPFEARVGVHCGAVVLRENSADDVAAGATPFEVDGLALPTAARIMSAARGGQTLLSAATAQAVGTSAGRLFSHGHWRLKGLDEPVELFEPGADAAVPTPPADTAKAWRVARREGQWRPVRELPHNLGAEPDAFVGRDEALHALARAFDDGARLITVLGTGGVGKTRLAQRYARGWLGDHPGGAWFCDLAAARSTDGIALAVAQALDLPLGRTDPVQQLSAAIGARGDCLLVLDNFEQVARCADASVGVWLSAAPTARFLVTSREVLAVAGEQVQVLPPLPAADAQALFERRMQAAGLALEAADAAALPALVDLLDRLPLAIELAAARARVVPPADQVLRMGERFRLLAGRGGRHDRQATLRATLDWSWDLLNAAEQSALAQLSVFEAGFTLKAAEAVVDLSATADTPWVADVLQSLVEKSLVRRVHARRFDLLRAVQDYAGEHLAVSGAAATATERHWRHFSGLTEPEATADKCVEIDNIVVACRRATVSAMETVSPGAAGSAVGALVNAWAALRLVGPFRVAVGLAQALTHIDSLAPLPRAQTERVLGAAAALMGDAEAAGRHYDRAMELARGIGEKPLLAQLLCLLADQATQQGRFEDAGNALAEAQACASSDARSMLGIWHARGNLAMALSDPMRAQRHYRAAMEIATLQRDMRWCGGLEGSLGSVAILLGNLPEAREHLTRSAIVAQQLGDRQWSGNARCNLGWVLLEMGKHDAAHAELDAALGLARGMGHRRLEATALCNLALVWMAQDDPASARDRCDEAIALAQALNSPRMAGQFKGYLGSMLVALGQEDQARVALDSAAVLLGTQGTEADRALLACQRACCLARLGDRVAAAAALVDAERWSASHVTGTDTALDAALRSARAELNRLR